MTAAITPMPARLGGAVGASANCAATIFAGSKLPMLPAVFANSQIRVNSGISGR